MGSRRIHCISGTTAARTKQLLGHWDLNDSKLKVVYRASDHEQFDVLDIHSNIAYVLVEDHVEKWDLSSKEHKVLAIPATVGAKIWTLAAGLLYLRQFHSSVRPQSRFRQHSCQQ